MLTRKPVRHVQRGVWFALFLACGLLVFVVFSHYCPLFSGLADISGRVAVALVLLAAVLVSWHSERFQQYESDL